MYFHFLQVGYNASFRWPLLQTAMEEALLRILTPRRSIDILRDVQSAKERARPYVIVFVGVNGVGKSTNLAKVCFSVHHMFMIKKKSFLGLDVNPFPYAFETAQVAYWLLQHNFSVTLSACDTFRSGAAEQLRTHARRLQVVI
jgi:signal recognition particle receptor subunit alpha